MKLTYFAYHFKRRDNGRKGLADIEPFLSAFCDIRVARFRNQFLYDNNEHLYLFKVPRYDRIFLFVMTRNNDIIKAVNTGQLECEEIAAKLDADEELGFASYVYVDNDFYGVAATSMGPKNTAFVHLINKIISKVRANIEFFSIALTTNTDEEILLRMPIMGKTIIEVERGNSLYDAIKGFLGNDEQIDSFELAIKPKKRRNIKDGLQPLIANLPTNGIQKFIVRAKADLADALTDFYLIGKGAVSDILNRREEQYLFPDIIRRVDANALLTIKIQEVKDVNRLRELETSPVSNFHNVAAWADIVGDLQV